MNIKIILWEQYIDQVKVDKTYTFTNVWVKKNSLSKEIYLNTAKHDQSEISETPPFHTQMAIPVNCINDFKTITQEGEVIAVNKVHITLVVISVQNKLTQLIVKEYC